MSKHRHNTKRKFLTYAKGYVYFRMPSGKRIRLPTDQTTIEFQRAYEACLAQRDGAPVPAARVANADDSLATAIEIYLRSPGYAKNHAGTRKAIRLQCDRIREEIGAGRLKDLDTDVIDICSERMEKQYGTAAADRFVFALSNIWNNVKKYKQFAIKGKANPTADAERRYTVQQEHRPWPENVQERFMATAPEHLKLAKILLHFSVQRGGDCVKMLWSDFDGKGIFVRPEKTHGERAAEPSYHLCPKPLLEALARAPRTAATILVNTYGQRYADASVLSKAIRRHLTRLGLAKTGERTWVMHGLRKTGATDAAEAGVEGKALQGLGNWKTLQMAEHYTKTAKARRANERAVELWDAELERKERERAIEQRRAQIHRVA